MDDSCFVRVGEIKINLFPLCLGTINNRLGNSSNSFFVEKKLSTAPRLREFQ